MSLLFLQNGLLKFGHAPLLDQTDFTLEESERIGLIGRNGTGKSTLLKVLAGLEFLDDGKLQVRQGLRMTYVPQEPVFDPQKQCLIRSPRAWPRYANGSTRMREAKAILMRYRLKSNRLAAGFGHNASTKH